MMLLCRGNATVWMHLHLLVLPHALCELGPYKQQPGTVTGLHTACTMLQATAQLVNGYLHAGLSCCAFCRVLCMLLTAAL